jgi:hypothetical protein
MTLFLLCVQVNARIDVQPNPSTSYLSNYRRHHLPDNTHHDSRKLKHKNVITQSKKSLVVYPSQHCISQRIEEEDNFTLPENRGRGSLKRKRETLRHERRNRNNFESTPRD